jgi:CBS domain-containing protein
MKVHEIMTAHARCVGPDNTLVEAAGLMRELDVGALPVCDGDRVTGLVTDRDIVLRGTADGRDPNTTAVRDVMSGSVIVVSADQAVEEVVRLMEDRQIRRVPVLGRNGRLVGIVSLGDIARSSSPAFSGMALRDVSEPRDPSARQRRLAEQSQPQARAFNRLAGSNGGATAAKPSAASSKRRTAAARKPARTASRTARKATTGAAAKKKTRPARARKTTRRAG